jgi:hypothetical protein
VPKCYVMQDGGGRVDESVTSDQLFGSRGVWGEG